MKKIQTSVGDFTYYWLSGNVLASNKHNTSYLTGGVYASSYNNQVTVTDNRQMVNTLNEEIFLKTEQDVEVALQVKDFNIPCLPGHKITAVRLRKGNYKTGPYVALVNHKTGDVRFKDWIIREMTKPSSATYWLWALLMPIAMFFSKDFLTILHIKVIGYYDSPMNSLINLFLFGVLICFWVLLVVVYKTRHNRNFKKVRNAFNDLEFNL